MHFLFSVVFRKFVNKKHYPVSIDIIFPCLENVKNDNENKTSCMLIFLFFSYRFFAKKIWPFAV